MVVERELIRETLKLFLIDKNLDDKKLLSIVDNIFDCKSRMDRERNISLLLYFSMHDRDIISTINSLIVLDGESKFISD